MPLTPFVAAAVALGADDTMHSLPHDSMMELAQQAHATAFIKLPIIKQKLLDLILGPEITAYHWAQGKAHAVYEQVFGLGATTNDHGRMVDYFASGCPHCKNLEPVWNKASQLWANQANEDSHRVVWEQKQCLDENWKPGPDYAECKAAQITQFPTVKMFAPGSQVGEEYYLEHTPDALVDFAKTGLHPNPDAMPRAPEDESDFKLVDFYAEGCKHCKDLNPIWQEAHKQWDKAIGQTADEPRNGLPLVNFEKRECYDALWNPGKDANECQKFHVDSFPTIKLFGPDPHGHGFVSVDYTGARTPQGIVDFLSRETGMQIEPAKVAELTQLEHNHAVQVEGAPAGVIPHSLSVPAVAESVGMESESHAQQLDNDEVTVEVNVGQPEENLAGIASIQHNDQFDVDVSVDKADENVISNATDNGVEDDAVNRIGDASISVGADLPQPMREAVKVAMMPLPMLAMSCLPVRKSGTVRTQRSTFELPPTTTAEFL